MALDPSQNKEDIIDTSFLKRKPLTKPRSEVLSPFQSEPIEPTTKNPNKEDSTSKNTRKQNKENSKESATKKDRQIFKYRSISINKDELENLSNLIGTARTPYYMYLKMISDENNCIKISLQSCAKLFGLNNIKSAQKILSDFEKKKAITLVKQANSKTQSPTEYKLEI